MFLLFSSLASAEIIVKYIYSDEPQTFVQQPQPVMTDVVVGTATYTSSSDIRVCSCADYKESFKVLNSGSQKEYYELKSNLDFVTLTPDTFDLAAGQAKDIQIEVNAPCKSLEKELLIKIFSSQGFQGELSKDLIVGKCQNLDVKLYTEQDYFKPCEVMNHKLYITNTGPFTETYVVASNTEMDPISLEIIPGGQKILELESAFGCEVYGEKKAVFFVEAVNNQLFAELSHDVTIEKDYDFSVIVDSKHSVCEESAEKITVKIKKGGDVPNNYNIELRGAPDFINLSDKQLSFESDELYQTFDLMLNPVEGKNIGTFNFLLSVTSQYGDLVEEKNLSLIVNDCYNIKAEILDLENEFCAENQEFKLKITNLGTMDGDVELGYWPEQINPEDDSFNLKAGQEAVLDVEFKPEDLTQKINLGFTVFYDGFSFDVLKDVEIYSLWDCYKVSVYELDQTFRYNKPGEFIVVLKHEGHKGGFYDVSLELNPLIPFTILSNVNSSGEVELYPGETKKFFVESNHTNAEFQTYEGKLNVDYYSLEYGQLIHATVKDKSICVKTYEYFEVNPCYFVSLILAILILVFFFIAIFAKKRRTRLNKRCFVIFIVILVLILLVSAFLLVEFKGRPYLNEPIDFTNQSETHYIWAQDKVYKVALEDVVSDPDTMDKLTVRLFQNSSYIDLISTENQIKFVPAKSWFGVEKVYILAIDDKGAFTVSPKITLEVVQRDKYNLITAYQKLCIYFNWLLLLVLFFFGLIVAYKRFRRKPKKPGRRNSKNSVKKPENRR